MTTLAILSLLTLMIAAATVLARKRQRAARERATEIPLFTVSASSIVPRPRPVADRGHTPPSFDAVARTPVDSDPLDRGMRFSQAAPTIRTRDGVVSTVLPPRRDDPASVPDETAGEAVDGASVRYWRAADGTLQFLPGRLVIAAGRDTGHEIRFVRTAGPDGTLITFGRAEGAPYRHVQLREPTVSRLHARMTLDLPVRGAPSGGAPRWQLHNLSSTNPVVVNGTPLDAKGGSTSSVTLSDGDRIEMGEVAFVFHAR